MSEASGIQEGAGEESRQPLVSVIMNCYNSDRYLRDAIESVLAQTYANWEIVFWDNQSTDDSASIFKGYNDPRLRYFMAPEHTTLGQARNMAINKVRGDYVAFLDCDDLWEYSKLQRQLELFKDNSQLGLVFCDVINFTENKKINRLYQHLNPPHGKCFSQLMMSYCIAMSSILVSITVFNKDEEWFDPNFKVLEDKDLVLRIAKEWQLGYVDEPLALWRVHGDSESHKHFDLFSRENMVLLEKFKKKYQNFEYEYAEVINKLEQKISFQDSVAQWRRGNGSEARRKILSNKISLKSFCFYLMSFLPNKYFKVLYRLNFVCKKMRFSVGHYMDMAPRCFKWVRPT